MIHTCRLLLVLLLSPLVLPAQDIGGTWQGQLDIQGMKLGLVLHLEPAGSGYTARMDSPDQGAYGIPVPEVRYEAPALALAVPALGVRYEGSLEADGRMAGTFRQGGLSLPLVLVRATAPVAGPLRPQEPKPPFPYREEDVRIPQAVQGFELAGTLTIPNGEGPFPAVVLVSGSGPQDRNQEILGHKPFLLLADQLVRRGIAVLRYDDRGVGASGGDFSKATSLDLSHDAEAAWRYLRQRPEADPKRVGILGHSEGGLIAPMVAAREPEVGFVISLAGPGVDGSTLLLMQNEAIGRASGMGEEALAAARRINEGAYRISREESVPEQREQRLREYFDGMIGEGLIPIPPGVDRKAVIDPMIAELTLPWIIHFLREDPAVSWRSVRCPVLAVNGDLDLQVPAEANLEAIAAALKAGGNGRFTAERLPGLNHLFQQAQTGLPTEYGRLEQTMDPALPGRVSDWILSLD
jgi:pimeloyl-ACP methyl ester carboxylesterase